MSTIIKVPHPTLRQAAKPIETLTPELFSLLNNLGTTLTKTTNPKGVGLAAPQIDASWRAFATYLSPADQTSDKVGERQGLKPALKIFVNPIITKHSSGYTFGPDKEQPTLEGCLSIPKLYGPVPRWEHITLEYQELVGEKLESRRESFDDFAARVVQHELDHLNGILFTDYTLEYDLPIYQEDPKTKQLVDLENRSILDIF
jgi:peptide deformylase